MEQQRSSVWNSTNNNSSPSDQMDMFQSELSASMIAIYVSLCTLGLFIIIVNALVIYLVITRDYLKTVTNLCLASLAVSDMFSGLYAIPLIIACSTHMSVNICIAMDLGQRFLSVSTVLHLLLITMERYSTIVLSVMRTTSVMNRKPAWQFYSCCGCYPFSSLLFSYQFWTQTPRNQVETNSSTTLFVLGC